MKKTIIAATAATLFALPAGVAFARSTGSDNFYAEAAIGANFGAQVDGYGNINDFNDFDTDATASYHLGAGYELGDFRLGLRYSYRDDDSSDSVSGYSPMAGREISVTANSDFSSHALMAEAGWVYNNPSRFAPFVKAGLGVARNSYSVSLSVPAFNTTFGYGEEDSTELAWMLGAGVDFSLNKDFSLFVEYQYTDLGEVRTKNDSYGDHLGTDHYAISEINLGLRYMF